MFFFIENDRVMKEELLVKIIKLESKTHLMELEITYSDFTKRLLICPLLEPKRIR